jgi:hypothetical protein
MLLSAPLFGKIAVSSTLSVRTSGSTQAALHFEIPAVIARFPSQTLSVGAALLFFSATGNTLYALADRSCVRAVRTAEGAKGDQGTRCLWDVR